MHGAGVNLADLDTAAGNDGLRNGAGAGDEDDQILQGVAKPPTDLLGDGMYL